MQLQGTGDRAEVPGGGERRPRRVGRVLKEIVLALVGIAGLLGLSWLVCAGVFGLSIVVFATGSMSPTMPTGSAAVVRDIPAAQIAVGDVVTVQRPGAALPVTHRVVAVALDPAVAGGRVVTLKGDANATPDLDPYELTKAKVVVAYSAGLGTVLAVLRTPFFFAVTTLVIALLVIWAFWPQQGTVQLGAHRKRTGASL